MDIPAWVKAARASANMTQEALGEALSVTKGNVSAWENGRHEPSYGQLAAISQLTRYPLMDHDLANSVAWPFQTVRRDAWERLSPEAKKLAESVLSTAIQGLAGGVPGEPANRTAAQHPKESAGNKVPHEYSGSRKAV